MFGPMDNEDDNAMYFDMLVMQREVKKMAQSDPEMVLFRLQDQNAKNTDGEFQESVQMEQRRWMLWAIYNVIPTFEVEVVTSGSSSPKKNSKIDKILALFETHGKEPLPGFLALGLAN
jgi:uncharacterized membrane protein (DUF106 family)